MLDQPDDADHQEDFESATDSTDSDALIFLMEMFPTLDRQTLLTKLRQNDFQLDETVNAILPLIQVRHFWDAYGSVLTYNFPPIRVIRSPISWALMMRVLRF